MTGKYWPPATDAKARQILREHAEELYREAERVAHRMGSHVVTPGYVDVAAHTVRMRRGSGASDVLMSAGTTIAGIGGGALVATAAEGGGAITSWVAWTSIGLLLAGSVLGAVGGTLKWREGH